MNERIQALRGRLPNGVLGIISMYDCHPTADLMKTVKIKSWHKESVIPAGMKLTVQKPAYWLPPFCWLLQEPFPENRWFYFRSWCYDTLPDMDYLPDWAVEQFLEERLAAWLDRGECNQ
jgi:hypothetical protein